MSRRDREVRRLSFGAVPETCPNVDAALYVAAEAIKEQTNALRAELNSAIERAMDAEDERDALADAVNALSAQVEELKLELAEATR